MPDNTRPPRNAHPGQRPNLGTRAFMHAIEEPALWPTLGHRRTDAIQ